MGGYGSTRWDGVRTRPTAQGSLRVTLSPSLRNAVKAIETGLKQGKSGGGSTVVEWSGRYGSSSSVGLKLFGLVDQGIFLQLTYAVNGQPVEDTIEIAYTSQQFGGRRAWWVCPHCWGRCSTLYCPLRSVNTCRFRCRACHQITYDSSNASDKRLSRLLAGPIEYTAAAIEGLPDDRGLMMALDAYVLLEQRRKRQERQELQRELGRKRARRVAPWLWK